MKNKPIKIELKAGDVIRLKIFNPKNTKEYTVYRITITKDAYKGDGIDEDIFEEETTGYEIEE